MPTMGAWLLSPSSPSKKRLPTRICGFAPIVGRACAVSGPSVVTLFAGVRATGSGWAAPTVSGEVMGEYRDRLRDSHEWTVWPLADSAWERLTRPMSRWERLRGWWYEHRPHFHFGLCYNRCDDC